MKFFGSKESLPFLGVLQHLGCLVTCILYNWSSQALVIATKCLICSVQISSRPAALPSLKVFISVITAIAKCIPK